MQKILIGTIKKQDRDILLHTLNMLRCKAQWSSSCKELREKYVLNPPDLIFIGDHAAEKEILDFCSAISSDRRRIPVIVTINNKNTECFLKRCMEVKIYDFIKKPYNSVELMIRLRAALEFSMSKKVKYNLSIPNNCSQLTPGYSQDFMFEKIERRKAEKLNLFKKEALSNPQAYQKALLNSISKKFLLEDNTLQSESARQWNYGLREILNNLGEIIFVIEPDLKIIFVNQYGLQNLGYLWNELIGENLDCFVFLEDVSKLKKGLQLSQMEAPPGGDFFEFRIIDKNGNLRDCIGSISNIEITESQISRLVLVCRDITQIKFLKKQFNQVEELMVLGRLTSSFIHEIKNPLNVLTLNLKMISAMFTDETPEKKAMMLIQEGIDSMKGVISNFSDLKSFYGANRQSTSINECIVRTWDFVQEKLRSRDIIGYLDLEENLPNVYVSPQGMSQIFLNLILNAIDSMQQGGELFIKTYFKKEQIFIEIKDSGTGILKKDLKHIFEPFFSTKKQKGMGLGLAISQDILKKNNGQIKVTSQINKGTTFTIILPAELRKNVTQVKKASSGI